MSLTSGQFVDEAQCAVAFDVIMAQLHSLFRMYREVPGGNFQVWLSYVFVYPAAKEHGDMASILAQNRLGTAESNSWSLLHLASGEANIFTVDMNRRAFYGTNKAGNRTGSR